jgi:hypothetical protein
MRGVLSDILEKAVVSCLAVAVLGILITAPLGAIWMDLTRDKLLK